MTQLIVLAVTFGLFWVLFIRPQQRRLRAHQLLVRSLEVGDEVVTTSGFYGTIRSLDGEIAVIELGPGIDVRIARGAIARRAGDQPGADGLDDAASGPDLPPGGAE